MEKYGEKKAEELVFEVLKYGKIRRKYNTYEKIK